MCVFGIVIALLLFIFLSAIEQLLLETERSAHIQLLQATLREEREILQREREQHAHALTEAKQASLTLEQRVAALEKELKEAHKQLENKQEKHEKCVDALARLKRAFADSDSDDVKPVVKKEKKSE